MKKIPKFRAPPGFQFKIYKNKYNVVHVALYNKVFNNKIGEVRLIYNPYNRHYSTHSNLYKKYQNKGLGILMYARAIQWCLEQGFLIKSSGATSVAAQRVWRGKSLRKYFKIAISHNGYFSEISDTFYPSLKTK